MKLKKNFSQYLFPKDYQAAIKIQKELKKEINIKTEFQIDKIRIFAACDNTIIKDLNKIIAGVIVFRAKKENQIEIVEESFSVQNLEFPYIPGLLSFREIPSLIESFQKLKHQPELIFVDGQGYAHPRRLGLATHLGIMLSVPSIGIAKSRFIGEYKEPGMKKGSMSNLIDGKEIIGKVYRNRDKVKPIFISSGYLISLEDSVKLVERFSGKYRIPTPTRIAHIETGKYRKGYLNYE